MARKWKKPPPPAEKAVHNRESGKIAEFMVWRNEVDEESMLDLFSLALGWLLVGFQGEGCLLTTLWTLWHG